MEAGVGTSVIACCATFGFESDRFVQKSKSGTETRLFALTLRIWRRDWSTGYASARAPAINGVRHAIDHHRNSRVAATYRADYDRRSLYCLLSGSRSAVSDGKCFFQLSG